MRKTSGYLLCLLLSSCATKAPVTIAHKPKSDYERYRVPNKQELAQHSNYTSQKWQSKERKIEVLDYSQRRSEAFVISPKQAQTKPYPEFKTASLSQPASTWVTKKQPEVSSKKAIKGIKADEETSAGNPSSYTLLGKHYKVLPFSNGFVEQGVASWYGPDFHGKKTSNGEIYDMHGMTAAHKQLPIPSYVRVTNLKNGRHVVLRINDRGPFHEDRVIDLSYAAAQKLDVHKPGTEQVKIEAINTPLGQNHESIYLQIGVFKSSNNARNLQAKVSANKLPKPRIKKVFHEGEVVYKVQLGPLYNTKTVDEFNLRLAKIGIDKTRYVTEK